MTSAFTKRKRIVPSSQSCFFPMEGNETGRKNNSFASCISSQSISSDWRNLSQQQTQRYHYPAHGRDSPSHTACQKTTNISTGFDGSNVHCEPTTVKFDRKRWHQERAQIARQRVSQGLRDLFRQTKRVSSKLCSKRPRLGSDHQDKDEQTTCHLTNQTNKKKKPTFTELSKNTKDNTNDEEVTIISEADDKSAGESPAEDQADEDQSDEEDDSLVQELFNFANVELLKQLKSGIQQP